MTVQTRPVDGGEPQWWHARYVIAADGAGSGTRRAAGIAMRGPATLAVMSNEYWRADLSRFPVTRRRQVTAYSRAIQPYRSRP